MSKASLLKGCVTLGLNIRLKGYISPNIYTPLDRGMVLLQLYRWKFSHKKTIRVCLIFIHKNDKFIFYPPFRGVRGNVRTSSIARWKARGRLPARSN